MFGNEKIKKSVIAGVTIFIISFWMVILGGCFNNMLVLGIGFGIIMVEAIAILIWQINKYDWKCNQCNKVFSITWKQNLTGINGGSVKELYCPYCGKKTWCDPVRKNSDNNNKKENDKIDNIKIDNIKIDNNKIDNNKIDNSKSDNNNKTVNNIAE